jgi:DNA (cytosine-5)-methyltransferase 1
VACVNSDPSRKGLAGDDTHVVTTPLMAHSGIHERQQTFVTGAMTGNGDAHSGFRLGDGLTVPEPVAALRGNSSADHVGDESRLILSPLQGHHPRDTTDDNVVTHALRSEGADASEDGTGRGTPLVAVPYTLHGNIEECAVAASKTDTHQALRSRQPGGSEGSSTTVVAFESTAGTRSLNEGETSPPLRVGSGLGIPSAPAVFCELGEGHQTYQEAEAAAALRTSTGGGGTKANLVTSFQERGREGGRSLETQEDVAYALTAPDGGSRSQEKNIAAGMIVRRLTPTECLRLMGLPDDFLDLDPPLSDSAKYRFIGDGGVTFVLEWIGNRIRAVAE